MLRKKLHFVQLPGYVFLMKLSTMTPPGAAASLGPLTPLTPPTDKREALKWRNRRAIVQAAAQLARERGLEGFTVKDLAAEAGVSRRTVFNHFARTEDAVLGASVDSVASLYGVVEEALAGQRFTDLPQALEGFIRAARQMDVIGTVCQAIVPFHPPNCRGGLYSHEQFELLAVQATNAVTRKIVELLQEKVDGADPFLVRLMGESLNTAVCVSAQHWFETTHGELTDQTRGLWDELLGQAVRGVQVGFGRPSSSFG